MNDEKKSLQFTGQKESEMWFGHFKRLVERGTDDTAAIRRADELVLAFRSRWVERGRFARDGES